MGSGKIFAVNVWNEWNEEGVMTFLEAKKRKLERELRLSEATASVLFLLGIIAGLTSWITNSMTGIGVGVILELSSIALVLDAGNTVRKHSELL